MYSEVGTNSIYTNLIPSSGSIKLLVLLTGDGGGGKILWEHCLGLLEETVDKLLYEHNWILEDLNYAMVNDRPEPYACVRLGFL